MPIPSQSFFHTKGKWITPPASSPFLALSFFYSLFSRISFVCFFLLGFPKSVLMDCIRSIFCSSRCLVNIFISSWTFHFHCYLGYGIPPQTPLSMKKFLPSFHFPLSFVSPLRFWQRAGSGPSSPLGPFYSGPIVFHFFLCRCRISCSLRDCLPLIGCACLRFPQSGRGFFSVRVPSSDAGE